MQKQYVCVLQSRELHGSVTLKGKVGERPLEFELPMSRATVMADNESQPLHRLAAKAQIKLLEDKEVAGNFSHVLIPAHVLDTCNINHIGQTF